MGEKLTEGMEKIAKDDKICFSFEKTPEGLAKMRRYIVNLTEMIENSNDTEVTVSLTSLKNDIEEGIIKLEKELNG